MTIAFEVRVTPKSDMVTYALPLHLYSAPPNEGPTAHMGHAARLRLMEAFELLPPERLEVIVWYADQKAVCVDVKFLVGRYGISGEAKWQLKRSKDYWGRRLLVVSDCRIGLIIFGRWWSTYRRSWFCWTKKFRRQRKGIMNFYWSCGN
jgi:hypothetical protein